MSDEKKNTERQTKPRKEYHAPQLKRWGKLRELTRGGGGTRKESFTNARTRF